MQDLRKLSEMSARERAFTTVYLSRPDAWKSRDKQIRLIKNMLAGNKDELEYFEENLKLIEEYLDKNKNMQTGCAIFACWVLNYFEVLPVPVDIDDLVWVDSSPYIRPLAEFEDEYETFAVVVADNERAKIYLVTSGVADDETTIKGNIKNHVRKGGWSQQRYERRRDKELLLYAKEIVAALDELAKTSTFRRIILAGSKETIHVIHENLPRYLADKVIGEKALDLGKSEKYINEELFKLFFEAERASETSLWETIKNHYMRGGLGVVGVEDVLKAVMVGRVERIIVSRNLHIQGYRCRDCESLCIDNRSRCVACGSQSVFTVDMVNEIVELASKTGATVDFSDEIAELEDLGGIAALLRY